MNKIIKGVLLFFLSLVPVLILIINQIAGGYEYTLENSIFFYIGIWTFVISSTNTMIVMIFIETIIRVIIILLLIKFAMQRLIIGLISVLALLIYSSISAIMGLWFLAYMGA